MERPMATEKRPALAGIDAAMAVSLALSLPLWRAVLTGNHYYLPDILLGGQAEASRLTLFALLGAGLLLTLPVAAATRRLAGGRGAVVAPLGLLISAGLLLLFQFGAPALRWLAALASIPTAICVWGALAQRTVGDPVAQGRYVNGWFVGLLLDLVLRYAAESYDVAWQRNAPAVAVVSLLVIATVVAAGLSWPRQPHSGEVQGISGTVWFALPGAAYMAVLGTQNLARVAVEWQRPLPAAALICAGYLLIGWATTRGLARGSGFAEVTAAFLLITLSVSTRDWETFFLALMGPLAGGGVVAAALAAPAAWRPGRAAAAAFGGVLSVWLAIGLAGLRDALGGSEGRTLAGIWTTMVILGTARAQVGVQLPPREERWGFAGLAGALGVALSVLAGPGAPPYTAHALTTGIAAMTFNLHRGVGRTGWLELERTAGLIEGRERVDIVGLQEVTRARSPEAGVDELGWLAERLGMSAAFAPTTAPDIGNALLSRVKITRSQALTFGSQGDRRGVLLVASLDASPPLTVVVTQLDTDPNIRRLQARELAGAQVSGDAITLIDLASDAHMRPYSLMTENARWFDAFVPGPQGGYTYPAGKPDERRDFVFFRGAMTSAGGMVLDERGASTHRPVVVRFHRP
jgi:endonuclease/exonuclease/phosphatase family metal-dependent hydrolase